MLKKALIALTVVVALYGLNACGKKAKQDETASQTAKPAINLEEMVYIPAGEFILGTDNKDSLAYPKQTVNLPAFWIDKWEATNSQFLDFSIKSSYVGEGAKEGKDWRLYFTPEKGMFPVVNITWNDANAYCKSLGKRLPTEEEWEKAARGPNGNAYPWGNEWIEGRSNTAEAGLRDRAAIGQFEDVSFYGVHDMLGNVQEWTGSLYSAYKGNLKKVTEGKNYRVVRGLSSRFRGKDSAASKAGRLWDRLAFPAGSVYDTGCRCAKDATPEDAAKAKK
jgi:formylglycine-generating enzyme required for sulfatase activity